VIYVDRFLDRVRSKDYRCFDFVREVWLESFGEDIGTKLHAFANSKVADRRIKPSEVRKCHTLAAPVDPCFVLMQRDNRLEPHIGIWYKGNVLHLAGTGAQYLPLEAVAFRYTRITYFL
jgi:hypothetical protein